MPALLAPLKYGMQATGPTGAIKDVTGDPTKLGALY